MNQIIFGIDARAALKAGVDKLANAVKQTYGAKGRNVIISQSAMKSLVTKDGVTVAKSIELNDPIENIGASLVKETASKTNELAGDGTTTSTVLTQAIIQHGFNLIEPHHNLSLVKKGMEQATQAAVTHLQKLSKKANSHSTRKQIASISANGDKAIGKLVADTLKRVGDDGVVGVEEASIPDTTVEFIEGMKFDNGYMSSYFINNHAKATTEFTDPLILLYDGYIQNIKDLVNVLGVSVKAGRPMLIIAEDIEAHTLNTLAYNCSKGELRVACVKAPGFGDRRRAAFEDIAALTGATVISKEEGGDLSTAGEEVLGSSDKVALTKEQTSILGGKGSESEIFDRVELIKSQIAQEEPGRERTHKEERLSKLTGGAAIIRVGGFSDVEKREKGERITDALCATKAAIEEGYLAGGGISYIKAASSVLLLKTTNDNERLGHLIIHLSLLEPFKQILRNAGLEEDFINENVSNIMNNLPYGVGYNVLTEKMGNLIKTGVVDSTKVQRVALENAASIAGTFLTSEVIIYNEESFL